eukprot:CAMPEP_0113675404 /NCGR_PEP_ID=MMETSP0038_2-20120614/7995_1 /TAXON_ID=2898 /ORGANISM="Cryptomonas paramecium" /LENGTH=218 /DNA_ID=CAMNT_0000592171 /DNA_START=178 /DNA_END=830 /DNA_ORIENTATION=- /assembly_acc=CAM_ASM_000170
MPISSKSSAIIYGTDTFLDAMSSFIASKGYHVIPIKTDTSRSSDVVVSELQRSGWGMTHESQADKKPFSIPQLLICELVLQTAEGHSALQFAREVKRSSPLTFVVIWSATAAESAPARLACFDLGANMVTQCVPSLEEVVGHIARHGRQGGKLSCVACGMQGLTEDELWAHYPMFHCNNPNIATRCVLCGKSVSAFAVHLHNDHGPPGRGEMPAENHR